jgi:DNA-3-methyladenine glycosylase II
VCFYSLYEAAAWTIIGNRIRIVQAARVKAWMAEELEHQSRCAEGRSKPSRSFTPAARGRFSGLPAQGRVPAHASPRSPGGQARSFVPTFADHYRGTRQAQELPGIGDFSAELILLRGAGEPTGALPASPDWHGRLPWPIA